MTKSAFARWMRRQVETRSPAAVVRFGDTEARLLLLAERGGDALLSDAAAKLGKESGQQFSHGDVMDVKGVVSTAFEQADVLGIGVIGYGTTQRRMWMGKLEALYRESLAAGRRPAALAHCLLSQDIVEDLPELLARRRVTVISCRNLKSVLESEWDVDDVRVHQVPSQHSARDVDGSYEASMHDVPIWPDAISRVRSELRVRERGEIALVGAGVFGKGLCIEIREQGGIALDMGSILDQIAGKITRGPMRRVVDMRAHGLSVDEIASRLSEAFGIEISREKVARAIAETDGVEEAIAAKRSWLTRRGESSTP